MSTTQVPSTTGRPSAGRRSGYLVAIGVTAVVLWAVHQLLTWGWPRFLTDGFQQVLPLISASLIVSMVVNATYLLRDQGRVRALGDLVNGVFGVAVSVRLWRVFPFDFDGYAYDWTWVVEVALVVGIVATAIAVIVNLVKLVTGRGDLDGSP
jgi:hypothetical protein